MVAEDFYCGEFLLSAFGKVEVEVTTDMGAAITQRVKEYSDNNIDHG
jgi:hypothetical protein